MIALMAHKVAETLNVFITDLNSLSKKMLTIFADFYVSIAMNANAVLLPPINSSPVDMH